MKLYEVSVHEDEVKHTFYVVAMSYDGAYDLVNMYIKNNGDIYAIYKLSDFVLVEEE